MQTTRREKEVWQAISNLILDGMNAGEITGEKIANKLIELGYKRGSSSDLYRFRKSFFKFNDKNENKVGPIYSEYELGRLNSNIMELGGEIYRLRSEIIEMNLNLLKEIKKCKKK